MKDSGSMMTENVPPTSFKLEREPTLMPSEFRERMSAKPRNRRSSAARSAAKRSAHTGNSTSTSGPAPSCSTMDMPNINAFQPELDNYHGFPMSLQKRHNQSPEPDYVMYGDAYIHDNSHQHIQLNDEMKLMFNNAYSNYDTDGGFTVRTPPSDMHIRDLMQPLDGWNSREAIREKKYPVLPSIKSPGSTATDLSNSAVFSSLSHYPTNNQLDFGRDKMEQEADFFADFRVNTSSVKATPRQDPLPPIKLAGTPRSTTKLGGTPRSTTSSHKHSNNSKIRSKTKEHLSIHS